MRIHCTKSAASAMLVVVAACSDHPTAPTRQAAGGVGLVADRGVSDGAGKVAVCHFSDDGARIVSIGAPALPAHREHRDYVVELFVDHRFVGSEDGIHFGRVGDALAAARATRAAHGELETGACRITIAVTPGVFLGSETPNADPAIDHYPLLVDMPDVTLRGSYAMPLDGRGRATNVPADGGSTVLAPVEPLTFIEVSTPILAVNGHPVGMKGNGVVIEGFVFRSGHTGIDIDGGGQAIFTLRVSDLVIRRNRFEQGFTESLDLRATDATVEQNHLGGGAGTCDMCLAGPGRYVARGNRLLAGGIPGIAVVPITLIGVPEGVEQHVLPSSSVVWAEVDNNEVRDHLRLPVGAGLRVGAIGIGAPDVAGTSHVIARGNTLVNNRFNVLVEAAFPVIPGSLRGDIDLTLQGNTIAESCQNNLLVSFSRHTTALGLTNRPYLRNSTYTLSLGGDISWADAWYGHPAGYGNTLIVDGVEIPNGIKHAYDGTKTCTP